MPPKNIYQNDPSFSPPVVPQAPISGAPIPPPTSIVPPPKKGFPKILIFIGVGLILLVIAFLAVKLLGPKGGALGEITWWGLWEEPVVVTPLIDEYQASHPGVKINYIKQSQQDYRERLTNALAKGIGPDIFSLHNSWVPMFKSDLDSLPAAVMNPADYVKTFYRTASSDLSTGNSIVGIPLGYDALVLYINEDIFSRSAKTTPTTWDDLSVLE